MKHKEFKRGYVITALWTEDPDKPQGDYEENGNHDELWASLPYSIKKEMLSDCDDFVAYCERYGIEDWKDISESKSAGADFWLSRNGHGAGFFDSGWYVSHLLQKAARIWGSYDALWIEIKSLFGSAEESE